MRWINENLTTIIILGVVVVGLYFWLMRKRYADSFNAERNRIEAEKRARRDAAGRANKDS
ncbi:MAG: hypothetical protein ACK4FK_06860 [Ferrovibrio sp.]|uniref:hypothetical protein n=1 Tax=Ferrovibrio sp. TaxID=1917215 RepID=UPI00391C6D98